MCKDDVVARRLQVVDAPLAADAIVQLKPTTERHPLANREAAAAFLAGNKNILIAALVDGKPVGYAIGYLLERVDRGTPMLLLYEIEVACEHRRQGIARSIIDALKRIANEAGTYKMWTLTDRANDAARALYRAAGARESGENLLVGWSQADLEP